MEKDTRDIIEIIESVANEIIKSNEAEVEKNKQENDEKVQAIIEENNRLNSIISKLGDNPITDMSNIVMGKYNETKIELEKVQKENRELDAQLSVLKSEIDPSIKELNLELQKENKNKDEEYKMLNIAFNKLKIKYVSVCADKGINHE